MRTAPTTPHRSTPPSRSAGPASTPLCSAICLSAGQTTGKEIPRFPSRNNRPPSPRAAVAGDCGRSVSWASQVTTYVPHSHTPHAPSGRQPPAAQCGARQWPREIDHIACSALPSLLWISALGV
jgi:hypothetical protein